MAGKTRQKQIFDDVQILDDLTVADDATISGDLTVTGTLTANGAIARGADAVTATADGLTTGLMTFAMGFITVTSASADNIITLPACVAADAGKKVCGWVGANGCEMRTPATGGATINGVDSDGTNEAAIPATSMFEATCVAADTWLLHAYTELGAVITAIVPDAA